MSGPVNPFYLKAIGVMGIIIALLPFVGVYTVVKDYFFFIFGILIAIAAYFIYSRLSANQKHPDAIHEEKAPSISAHHTELS